MVTSPTIHGRYPQIHTNMDWQWMADVDVDLSVYSKWYGYWHQMIYSLSSMRIHAAPSIFTVFCTSSGLRKLAIRDPKLAEHFWAATRHSMGLWEPDRVWTEDDSKNTLLEIPLLPAW